ncbi:MAG: hypothetical protein WA647_06400 [Candidatus Acidiferrum sp.]
MRKRLHIFGLLSLGLLTGQLTAQSSSAPQLAPLCELQNKVAQGDRQSVRVEGVYLAGLEGQYLVTSGCSGRSTSIEFELTTHRLWKQLVRLSNRKQTSGGEAVLVVFEGEFYGPQMPDPKLPEAIRKNYHPGWDHMNASMTKMVVHAILSVKPLPPNHPCAPLKADPHQWPCWQNPAPQGQGLGESVGHEANHAQGASAP